MHCTEDKCGFGHLLPLHAMTPDERVPYTTATRSRGGCAAQPTCVSSATARRRPLPSRDAPSSAIPQGSRVRLPRSPRGNDGPLLGARRSPGNAVRFATTGQSEGPRSGGPRQRGRPFTQGASEELHASASQVVLLFKVRLQGVPETAKSQF